MNKGFAIITPCHNEAAYIGATIASVLAQTLLPTQWLIVNDASSDATEEEIKKASHGYSFVRLITLKRPAGRSFGFKAHAFNHALAFLDLEPLSYIGNLDADICLSPNYFSNIVTRFEHSSRLGICGGQVFTPVNGTYITEDFNPDSVAGAVQLFRKACFKDIGGRYLSLPYGGIDAASEFLARQKGWLVEKSSADHVLEQRRTGSVGSFPLKASFRLGRRFHSLGYGSVFYALRCLYRLRDRPLLLASIAAYLGYLNAVLRRDPVLLPKEVVAHLRARQRQQFLRKMPIPAFITKSALRR